MVTILISIALLIVSSVTNAATIYLNQTDYLNALADQDIRSLQKDLKMMLCGLIRVHHQLHYR